MKKRNLCEETVLIDLPAVLPPSPDGGWGWMVVGAAFLINLLVDGVGYSFNVYLEKYSSDFNISAADISLIASVQTGLCLCSGPFVSSLTNKFGCRPICTFGSLLSSLGFISTIAARSLTHLMLTQGLIVGLGNGMVYLPAIVCVSHYFEKKRAIATTFAVCGSGLGVVLAPPIIDKLIGQVGWRKANLIIGGCYISLSVLAALMKPIKVPKMTKSELLTQINEERKVILSNASLHRSLQSRSFKRKLTSSSQFKNCDSEVNSHSSFSVHNKPKSSFSLHLPEKNSSAPPNERGRANFELISDEESHATMEDSMEVPYSRIFSSMDENQSSYRNYSSNIRTGQLISSNPRRLLQRLNKNMSVLQLVNNVTIVPATDKISYMSLQQADRFTDQSQKNLTSSSEEIDVFDRPKEKISARTSSLKDENSIILSPLTRKDIFYSGSLCSLNEFKRQGSLASYRQSTFCLPNVCSSAVICALNEVIDEATSENDDKGNILKLEKQTNFLANMCIPLKEQMNLSMLTNKHFLLLAFANFCATIGFVTPFIFLPSAALQKDVNKEKAALIVSIIGIANIVGRILSGVAANYPKMKSLVITTISLLFSGIGLALTPLAVDFMAFAGIGFFYGFSIAPFLSLTSLILVDLFGLDNLTNTFGLLMVFRGIASLIGPPLAGGIYDQTGNYDASFLVSGGLIISSSFIYILILALQTFSSSPDDHVSVRYQTNEECLQAIPEEEIDDFGSQEEEGLRFDVKQKIDKNLSEQTDK